MGGTRAFIGGAICIWRKGGGLEKAMIMISAVGDQVKKVGVWKRRWFEFDDKYRWGTYTKRWGSNNPNSLSLSRSHNTFIALKLHHTVTLDIIEHIHTLYSYQYTTMYTQTHISIMVGGEIVMDALHAILETRQYIHPFRYTYTLSYIYNTISQYISLYTYILHTRMSQISHRDAHYVTRTRNHTHTIHASHTTHIYTLIHL